MKRKRYRTQVTIRMIEYELYGRRMWWPESLSKKESEDIAITLQASGCKLKVHVLKLSNAKTFVEPIEIPIAALRSNVGQNSKNRNDLN